MKYVILTMLLYVNSFADLGFNLEPTLAIEGNSRGMGLATASLMLNMHLNDKISTGMAYSKSEEPGFENKYPVHTSNAVSIYGRYDTKKLKYLDFSWQFGLGYINGITRGKFIKKEITNDLFGDDKFFTKELISSPSITQSLRMNIHGKYLGFTLTETLTYYFNDVQGGLAIGLPIGIQ